MPLIDYAHSDGCSITGGYVYRGSAIPEIAGRYFYSDFCGGWLRSFFVAGGNATSESTGTCLGRQHPVIRCRFRERTLRADGAAIYSC
jgi:hypothetical protein